MKRIIVLFLIVLSTCQSAATDNYTITRNGETCSTHPVVTGCVSAFFVAYLYSLANGNLIRKTN